MKHYFLILTLIVTSFNALAQEKASKKEKKRKKAKVEVVEEVIEEVKLPEPLALVTPLDSLSYALGMIDATFFKSQGVDTINLEMMNHAFTHVLKEDSTLLTTQQADMTIREQLQAFMRKKSQAIIDEGTAFLEENKKRDAVKVTESGLQYEVITEGTGEKPTANSTVNVHYEGFLWNGKKFDSSRDRGEPISFGLNQVIPGWSEGVQLMTVGSRYKIYLPHTLGYGEQGAGGSIPGGAALVFDVELLGIDN